MMTASRQREHVAWTDGAPARPLMAEPGHVLAIDACEPANDLHHRCSGYTAFESYGFDYVDGEDAG
jgi:hypothetical protein